MPNSLQKLTISLLPKSMAETAERESKKWVARCRCGHERSIWELGGVRYRARGNPLRLMKCPTCKKLTWHRVVYHDQACDPSQTPIKAELVGADQSSKNSSAGSFLSKTLNLAFVLISIVSALASVVGIVLVMIAISLSLAVSSQSSGGNRTTGMVVDIDDATFDRPVVGYSVDDREYRIRGRIGFASSPYSMGQPVSVSYNPRHPAQARIDDWVERGGPLACIGSIIGMIGTGGLLLIWRRRCRSHARKA